MSHPVAPHKAGKKPRKTSSKLWISFIILPFVLLFVVSIAQMLIAMALSQDMSDTGTGNVVRVVVNVISVIVGVVAVVFLVLMPLWIILLIGQTEDGNKSKTVAVVLAVFFSMFSWLYTYKHDAWKFWLNLALTIVTLGMWTIVAYFWVIIDQASKPPTYYKNYHNRAA